MNIYAMKEKHKSSSAAIGTLNYIDELATELGVNIIGWDIAKEFEKDNELIHSKTEINKIFFSLAKNTGVKKDIVLPKLSEKELLACNDARVQIRKNQKAESERQLGQLQTNISNYQKKMDDWTLQIRGIIESFNNHENDFTLALKEILELGFVTYSGIDYAYRNDNIGNRVKEPRIFFITRPLTMVYKRGDKNLYLPIGKLSIRWTLYNNIVHAFSYDENISYSDYFTPFTDGDSGGICFGSQASEVTMLQGQNKMVEVFKILETLFTQYHKESNPYVAFETFYDKGVMLGTNEPWQKYYEKKVAELSDGKKKEEEKATTTNSEQL